VQPLGLLSDLVPPIHVHVSPSAIPLRGHWAIELSLTVWSAGRLDVLFAGHFDDHEQTVSSAKKHCSRYVGFQSTIL
jgi:hypothetical protein